MLDYLSCSTVSGEIARDREIGGSKLDSQPFIYIFIYIDREIGGSKLDSQLFI